MSNTRTPVIIEIDKVAVDKFKNFLIQSKQQKQDATPGEKAELERLMKEYITDFFDDAGDLYIDNDINLTRIGNVPFDVKEDIRNFGGTTYTNIDYQNMSWATIKTRDIGDDIWLIFWREDKGVYVFELPEEDEFELSNFKVTSKTQLENDGWAVWRDYNKRKLCYATRGPRPQNQGADVVIDFNEDCFQEVLGCTNENCDDGNFTQYLRAKLDFRTGELFVYPEKNPVSEEEYKKRREDELTKLSAEQKPAAETKVKASLINAGAGCGKTTTLMGRILYLCKNREIKSPDDLILVAFNRKNRKDFRKQLKRLGMAEYAKKSAHTFHSLGCSIIRATGRQFKCLESEDNDSLLDMVVRLFENPDYEPNNPLLVKECKGFSDTVKQILAESDWMENMRSWSSLCLPDLPEEDPNTGEPNPEYVRLMELYEKFIPSERQRLVVSQLDKLGACLDVDNYSFDDDNIRKMRVLNYLLLSGNKDEIDKVNDFYKYVKIKSMYRGIYWDDYDCSSSFGGIESVVPPVSDNPLSEKEIEGIIEKAIIRARTEEFRNLAKQFISLCKVYNITDLNVLEQTILNRNPARERYISGFFNLIRPVNDAYETFLKKYGYLDFNDMINQATETVKEDFKHPKYDNKFKYKYIFVDEFQDVAEDNFKLIKALRDRSNASITCVGDDWQAIYSWRGSDLKFFNDFKNQFGIKDEDYEEFQVTQTHRYGKDLVDVSNDFIRSKDQNEKALKAVDNEKETKLIKWTDKWTDLIAEIKNEYGTDISLKVLQRRKRDARRFTGQDTEKLAANLQREFKGIDESRKDTTDVLTIHKSKGLEADVVIILDLKEKIFPSSKAPDIILVELQNLYNSTTNAYAEERRLLYVAMTRAKKSCYFFNPSGAFWDELINNPKNEDKIQSKPTYMK